MSSGSKYSPSASSSYQGSIEESSQVSDSIFNEAMKSNQVQRKKYRKRKNTNVSTKDSSQSDESEAQGEPVKKTSVSLMKLQKKKDGARVYSKRHFCFFCSAMCHKMSRHLIQKHSHERDVVRALSFPLKSKERKLRFDIIRNRGDRAHNLQVLKVGSGMLVPSKQTDLSVEASEYLHCINCAALLKPKSLWRHVSRCRLSHKNYFSKPGKSRIQSVCAFSQPAPEGLHKKVWELVNCMHQDEVTGIIRKEKNILRLGEYLYMKHGHDYTKH
ncbi:hypothetical protein NL108_016308 [Boleophthalmus pectinirostris]|nr:hypothetical protein NL108_016308 [Boleophthalmus pectinirostris]